VLGANDGLVSILSLVMGVAGGGLSQQDILVAGLSGLLAGACSMAMGGWVSVQHRDGAVVASVVLSGALLFAIGAAIPRLTARPAWRSGLRPLVFGLLAAAVTFGIGNAVGWIPSLGRRLDAAATRASRSTRCFRILSPMRRRVRVACELDETGSRR
jgi:VIT1/CCC1 family predicted Fe2+/Mn2+ transporter